MFANVVVEIGCRVLICMLFWTYALPFLGPIWAAWSLVPVLYLTIPSHLAFSRPRLVSVFSCVFFAWIILSLTLPLML